MCTHSCLLYSFPLVLFGDTLLLLSSRRRGGVHPELPGVRGLLGVRLQIDIPVVPSFREFLYMYLRFRCIRYFVIHVINNIRTRFIISFYMICAVIYCSFCCIYVWIDPGTYMVAQFMSFCKPGVTISFWWASILRSWSSTCFLWAWISWALCLATLKHAKSPWDKNWRIPFFFGARWEALEGPRDWKDPHEKDLW